MEILYIIVTDYSMVFWRCSSTDRMEVSEASDLGSIPNIATECFKSCYLLEQVNILYDCQGAKSTIANV